MAAPYFILLDGSNPLPPIQGWIMMTLLGNLFKGLSKNIYLVAQSS